MEGTQMATPLETQLHRIQTHAKDAPHIGVYSTLRRLHHLTFTLQKIQQIIIRQEENTPKPYLDNLLELHLLEIGALCWEWGCENMEGVPFQNLMKWKIEDNLPTILNAHSMALRMLQLLGKISGEKEYPALKDHLADMLFLIICWLNIETGKETQK